MFGSRASAVGGSNDGGSDEDPLLEPVTAAAVITHCCVSDMMSAPRMMVRKSLFLSTVMASKDIRQFRAICVLKELYTTAEAEAVRDKKVLFEKLIETCPFL